MLQRVGESFQEAKHRPLVICISFHPSLVEVLYHTVSFAADSDDAKIGHHIYGAFPMTVVLRLQE